MEWINNNPYQPITKNGIVVIIKKYSVVHLIYQKLTRSYEFKWLLGDVYTE